MEVSAEVIWDTPRALFIPDENGGMLHKIAGMETRQFRRVGISKSEATQPLLASFIHLVRELHNPAMALPQIRRLPRAGRDQDQSIKDFSIEARCLSQHIIA